MSSIRGTSPFGNNFPSSIVTRPVTSLSGQFSSAAAAPASYKPSMTGLNPASGLFGKIGGYFKRLTMAFLGRSGEEELAKSKDSMTALAETETGEYGDTDPLIGRWPDETKPIPNPFAVKRESVEEPLLENSDEQAAAFSPAGIQSLGNEQKEQQEALKLLAQQIAGGGSSAEGSFAEI